MLTVVPKCYLLLTFTFQIVLLEAVLRSAVLLLQSRGLLLRTISFLIEILTVLAHSPLLLLNKLLLSLL